MELKGDWARAIQAYERAHELEPSNSTYEQARQEAVARRDATSQGATAHPFGPRLLCSFLFLFSVHCYRSSSCAPVVALSVQYILFFSATWPVFLVYCVYVKCAGAAAAEGGVDLNSLMKNPAFMQMANSMMANPQTLSMLQRTFGEALGGAVPQAGGGVGAQVGAGAVPQAGGGVGVQAGAGAQPQAEQTATAGTGAAAGAPPGPGNMSALLAMGQQLAAQMQASNPELVEQLREQFRSVSQPHDRPPSS